MNGFNLCKHIMCHTIKNFNRVLIIQIIIIVKIQIHQNTI